jgi:hypothetical protein
VRRLAAPGFLVALGCASAPPVAAENVTWSEVVPRGYVVLGDVEASCTPGRAWGAFHDAPATSLFCERTVLERALVEKAARRGGTLLALTRCADLTSGALACSAVAARPEHGGASPRATPTSRTAPPLGTDSDALSAVVASQIAIDLEPGVPHFARRARSGAEVQERAWLPVGHRELGILRARCDIETCTAEQARAGLRAAAGALGVADLVGVRCTPFDGERTCVAALAATERDPATDPAAR